MVKRVLQVGMKLTAEEIEELEVIAKPSAHVSRVTGLPTVHLAEEHIPRDDDGWISAKEYLPYPYDLVVVKTDKDHTWNAWYDGEFWDGYRLTNNETVLRWIPDSES